MSILVTGGLGYIGSHTVLVLLEHQYDVVIVDDLSNSQIETLAILSEISKKSIPFYNIDVADMAKLNLVFQEHAIQGVIHFAGYKSVGESVFKPLEYYRNNLLSTITLAELCVQYHVSDFVFSSSATVYGDNPSPLHESMTLKPTTNPYGETKVMNERILRDVSSANPGLSVTLLRYFNPIGAHPSGLIGEVPNGIPNNLMPYITQVAKGLRERLSVFGNDYPTSDGTGVRDYIHVMDLADGHVKALERAHPGIQVYNLGTGKGTSVLELIHLFESENKIKIPYIITDRRPGDLAEAYADASKAKTELQWVTKRTLKDMVRDSWNFEKSRQSK
jgi:UDP-glucose 4-epimerase